VTSVDLAALGLLPSLPSAFLEGRDLDLLGPLRFLPPGEIPGGPAPAIDRAALAEALAVTNASYGHPRAVELADKLADPATRVVIAGQQPGLGGGPLYTLSKAMAVARWAEELERRGRAAVPVFWVATEDHDFAEVARLGVPGRDGLEVVDLGEDPAPLTPVGMRSLGEGVNAVFEAWRAVTRSESYLAWLDRVATWCRPDARFGEAFSRVLVGMLGERCPLLADAMLPAIKRAQSPLMVRLIEQRGVLEERLAAADSAIESRGHALQVSPQRDTSPLFLLHGGERRRVVWVDGERYGLRGLDGFEGGVGELLEIARDNPAVISPGVLARPALQDAVFGSFLVILGPGEVSYLPQAAPVHLLLGVEAPWVAARPQILVLQRRQMENLREAGVELDDLVRGAVDADAVVAAAAGEDPVAPALERVRGEMTALRQALLALDGNLERPFEKTVSQVERALETLSGKAVAAVARRHDVDRRRIESLIETVRPGGTLQERAVAGAHFVGLFEGFSDRALAQLDLDPRFLHWIDPEGSDAGQAVADPRGPGQSGSGQGGSYQSGSGQGSSGQGGSTQ
jgi:bacillithiol biosynthesis cysteine-adding enzyme BshC